MTEMALTFRDRTKEQCHGNLLSLEVIFTEVMFKEKEGKSGACNQKYLGNGRLIPR